MRYFNFIIFSALLLMAASCSKGNNSGGGNEPPTNLQVTANVNPNNSGNVSFTATATNAVSYDFDFGNGVIQTVSTGSITYRYWASGTYAVKVFASGAGGQTISTTISVTVNVVLSLVWSDEFDTPGAPDAAKWGYDLGAGGWGNNELQNYTNRSDNAVVSGGTLKIIAKAESFNGSPYTSARLLTKDKYSMKYGKIEARIKLPAGVGTWPAFWMLGSNISTVSWPACGEIDIMEHVGRDLNKIYATLHYTGNSGAGGVGNSTLINTATSDFHIYTAEWSDVGIKFSVDGQVFHTFINNGGLPFNQNFFIILNIAIGGNFAGPVDPAFSTATMEVDYVRVYQ
jgi:beta-glucanase (GH16 family)